MYSRQYTSDVLIFTIGIKALVSPLHQGLYPNVDEIGIKCLVGGDSLLHFSVCYKTPARQVLLMESR